MSASATRSGLDAGVLAHRADPPPLPAAGGLRRAAAGGAQGVDGDLRRTSPRCARATGRTRPATPTACTARRPPSRSRSASPRSKAALQTLLAPSGLAAIALVDIALLKAGDEVLLPDNVYGPSKELARGELARLGHHAPLLRPAGPGLARRRDRPGDAAGLARGRRLGDDGVPRPAGAGRDRRARAASPPRSTTPGAPASPSTRSHPGAAAASRSASTSRCRR